MKRILIAILAVALLLVGCAPNGAALEELQSEIAELEEQLAEKEARQNKNEAIAEFAQQALELQRVIMDVRNKWVSWSQQNLPDNYPRYASRSKELEAVDETQKLFYEVKSVITKIEQLYAPLEAIETKRKLLAEGDSLQQAFVDIIDFYAAPDVRPTSLYDGAWKVIYDDLGEIDKVVRRELTDLALEYGQ